MNKFCKNCKESKPLETFVTKSASPNNKGAICKPCASKNSSSWYFNNLDKAKNAKLLRAYGITIEQYLELSTEVGNKCTICEQDCPSGRALAVDHDHSNGIVRGLLCINCNKGLGNFKDNLDLFKRAMFYLESYKEALEESKVCR